jgi:hypothetical protein
LKWLLQEQRNWTKGIIDDYEQLYRPVNLWQQNKKRPVKIHVTGLLEISAKELHSQHSSFRIVLSQSIKKECQI